MKKDVSIETLRGIAIILMVAGHVVGDSPTTGLKIQEGSFLRYVFYIFLFIRMPLFSAISGYIYASHAITKDTSITTFIKKKIIRLLIPFITATTIFYIFKKIIPEVNNPAPEINEVWRIYIFSWFHFWFVQAIFLVFVVISFLEKKEIILSRTNWMFVTVFAFIIYLLVNTGEDMFWSINKFFFIFPFFLFGLGLYRFKSYFTTRTLRKALVIIFVITFSLQQYYYFKHISLSYFEEKILLVLVGVSGIATLIFIRPVNNILASLGYYSFVIYLYHVFGTAGNRLLFQSVFHVTNTNVLFCSGLFAGILLPILLQKIFQGFPVCNLLLFGQKPVDKMSKMLIQSVVPQTQPKINHLV